MLRILRGEDAERRTLEHYLAQAKNYSSGGICVDPSLHDHGKLADYLMKTDGVDLGKIRRGEQAVPEEVLHGI